MPFIGEGMLADARMKVVIDDIEYVPNTVIEHTADEQVQKAVRELVQLYFLYGVKNLCRGQRSCVLGALRALAPNVADLIAEGRYEEAYDV